MGDKNIAIDFDKYFERIKKYIKKLRKDRNKQ